MMAVLRSELRKLFTVRSTYIVTAFALGLVGLMSYLDQGSRLFTSESSRLLQDSVLGSLLGMSVFFWLVPILLITHEYRYNTIYHTLTQSTGRAKVFVSKIVVGLGYALCLAICAALLTVIVVELHSFISGNSIGAQHFDWLAVVGRGGVFAGGTAMFAMLIAFILRNQIGTLAVYLVAPNVITGLSDLILRKNAVYIPFNALNNMIIQVGQPSTTPGKSAIIVGAWAVAVGIGALLLFLRRDAN